MELLNGINWAVIAPILVLQAILMIAALIDLVRIESAKGPKWCWVLVILFINIIGPIIYFLYGRRTDG